MRYVRDNVAISRNESSYYDYSYYLDTPSLQISSNQQAKTLDASNDVLKTKQVESASALLTTQVKDAKIAQASSSPGLGVPNRTKPKLVIHIGPMKTGSTTLQKISEQDRDSRTLLQDGWIYPSRNLAYVSSLKQPCRLSRTNDKNSPTYCDSFDKTRWNQVETFLKRLQNLNKENPVNGYWIDEMFGIMPDQEQKWKMLQNAFEPFDVHLIVAYRRYFEWFVSFYEQAFKYGIVEEEITSYWPPPVDDHRRYNNRVKTIAEYHELLKIDPTSIMMRRWGVKHGELHPMEAQRRRFQPHFKNPINILNIHDVDTSTSNLVADFYKLLNATKSYRYRQKEGLTKRFNDASDESLLFYDILAMEASDQGILDVSQGSNMDRKEVSKAVRSRYRQLMEADSKKNEFPLICMSKVQLEELKEMSLRMEAEVMPKQWASKNRENHLRDFETYVNKKYFCSIDAKKALKQPGWIPYFRSLKLLPKPAPSLPNIPKP